MHAIMATIPSARASIAPLSITLLGRFSAKNLPPRARAASVANTARASANAADAPS